MQQDEVIWQVINQGHCSFKSKPAGSKSTGKSALQTFCRHEYNVTGLCNRSSCPLANSRYATIREHNGRLYLCLKTIERAHTPKNLWEKIRLPRNYAQALATIDKHLEYWPKFLVHKNKQRLTKITQYLIRMRKLAGKVKPKLFTKPARAEKLEARREKKAEAAAKLDTAIETELLERLKSGTYGDIYNFPAQEYEKALDGLEEEYEIDDEEEEEAEELNEEEPERELEDGAEFVEGDIEDLGGYDEDDYDSEDDADLPEEEEDDLEETESTGKRRKVPRATKAHLKRAIKRKIGRDQRQFEVEEEHELDNPETRA